MVTFLTVGQHPFDGPDIGCIDDSRLAQSPFSLGGLAGQNVAAIGLGTDDLAFAGGLKSLGSASSGFHLGHNNTLLIDTWPEGSGFEGLVNQI